MDDFKAWYQDNWGKPGFSLQGAFEAGRTIGEARGRVLGMGEAEEIVRGKGLNQDLDHIRSRDQRLAVYGEQKKFAYAIADAIRQAAAQSAEVGTK